ncbi:MAG: phosphatidylserine decarboxylase [Lachnospiraceae bacterium]|nr:phosphatidylserine decarboxylase [Lachnospiraceae bacterium]MBQ5431188.1 phosphatidylserine decarboxylase [Lachnospiraceae bacterium]
MASGVEFLYGTIPGRILLKLLTARKVSKLAGRFLDSSASKFLIRPFVEKNGIDLTECEFSEFRCFNDCFTRRLKRELRPIDREASHLISPCDGLLRVWSIQDDFVLPVKESEYRISDLLRSEEKAQMFKDGYCLVFRLCVNHYHRYCYIDDGKKGENYFIPGKLHTVRPIALRSVPVFTENCREYTLMETENFGWVTQIEVGAMLVGKIANLHGSGHMTRGEEKGKFLYGGSTIVVLLQKDAVTLREDLWEATAKGEEVPVRMGECIGWKEL